MAVQDKKGIQTKNNVIVMDMKDDENRKQEAVGMMDLSKKLRESKFNITRVIMAIHDPDVGTFFNIPQTDSRKYAMIEVFDDKNPTMPNSLELKMKMVQGFLSSQKYKTVASKVFKNKEYPLGKIIVKF